MVLKGYKIFKPLGFKTLSFEWFSFVMLGFKQLKFNRSDLNKQTAIFAKQRLEIKGASCLSFLVFYIKEKNILHMRKLYTRCPKVSVNVVYLRRGWYEWSLVDIFLTGRQRVTILVTAGWTLDTSRTGRFLQIMTALVRIGHRGTLSKVEEISLL